MKNKILKKELITILIASLIFVSGLGIGRLCSYAATAGADGVVTSEASRALEETTAAEIELALLPHSYEDTWQENSGYHWHKCSVCGAKDSTEAHVYSSQNDNSCNICGHIKGIEMPIIEF